jgi:hypothetical protein
MFKIEKAEWQFDSVIVTTRYLVCSFLFLSERV